MSRFVKLLRQEKHLFDVLFELLWKDRKLLKNMAKAGDDLENTVKNYWRCNKSFNLPLLEVLLYDQKVFENF